MLTESNTTSEASTVEPIKIDPKDTSIPLAERIAAAKAAREAKQKAGKNKAKAAAAVANHPVIQKTVAKISKKPAKVAKANPKPKVKAAAPKKDKGGSVGSGKAAVEATCSICHKPLSRHSSIQQGMGDTCAAKIKLLPKGVTLEQHYESITKTAVPEGWITIAKAVEKARAKGVSGYRFLQACGGDRMLRKPINSYFKVFFVSGTRYVDGECLKHLSDLEKI